MVLDAWLTPPPSEGADVTAAGRLPEPARFELDLPACPLESFPPNNAHPAWNAGGKAVGYRWGNGPAVLLVHGWGGSAGSFALWIGALLKAGFSVAAIDGPAHGNSPGVFASAPAIAGAIRAFGKVAGPFHSVVAHSVGAIATALAASDGQLFEKAVFLAPCCSVGHSLTDEARRQGLPSDRDPAL
ncbi:MAG: alpha/beta hydrolase, partial [Armatimonadaceae bacterium]